VATNGSFGNEAQFFGAEGVAGGVAVQRTREGMCLHIPKNNDLIDDILSTYVSYIGVAQHTMYQNFSSSSFHCQIAIYNKMQDTPQTSTVPVPAGARRQTS